MTAHVSLLNPTATAQAEPAPAPGLRTVDLFDLLEMDLPARPMVLDPVIPSQGLAMLHAPRGIGKTFVGLSIAYAVASGGTALGRWSAPEPRRVLYIDGEMPGRTMQERLAAIAAGAAHEPEPGYLRLLTPDLQEDPMPNLATPYGKEAVEPLLEGVGLVVVDNLATCARAGRENDSESWLPVQEWLLGLRRRGLSVLLVHHSGKGGGQRGTSAKEDILDTVISLRRPDDYTPEEGARFEVHLEKARGIVGDGAKPFEAALSMEGGAATWRTRDIEDVKLERVRALHAEGLPVRDIAEETGISKSTVHRMVKRIEAGQC